MNCLDNVLCHIELCLKDACTSLNVGQCRLNFVEFPKVGNVFLYFVRSIGNFFLGFLNRIVEVVSRTSDVVDGGGSPASVPSPRPSSVACTNLDVNNRNTARHHSITGRHCFSTPKHISLLQKVFCLLVIEHNCIFRQVDKLWTKVSNCVPFSTMWVYDEFLPEFTNKRPSGLL